MKPKDVLGAAATRLTEEKVETSGPHEATFLMIARLWAAYLKVPVLPPACRRFGLMMAGMFCLTPSACGFSACSRLARTRFSDAAGSGFCSIV